MEKLWEQLNGYIGSVTSQPTLPHQISDIAGELANVSLLVGNKSRFLETVNMFTSKNISDIRFVTYLFVFYSFFFVIITTYV